MYKATNYLQDTDFALMKKRQDETCRLVLLHSTQNYLRDVDLSLI